jgi:glycine betaine/proline transport system ATP-binding protein
MLMRGGMTVQIGTPAELILNPADDYVADFTRDVPIVRVMTAADVLCPGPQQAGLPEIEAAASVEDMLPRLASHPHGLAVMRGGERIGTATVESVIGALARRAGTDCGEAERASATAGGGAA